MTALSRPSGLSARIRRTGFAVFALTARSLQQISALVVTLLAARFLTPAEYGVYSLAIVFILFIQTMTYTGFYHFIVTSNEDEAAVLSTSFWLITGLATAAAFVLAVFSYPISWAFDAPDLAPVLLFLAAAQPFAGAGAWSSAVLMRQERMSMHFGVMFAQNFGALIGGVILLIAWKSIFALVAFRWIRVLTGTVLYLFTVRVRPQLRFDRTLARRATKFSGGLYGSRLLGFLSRYAGDLLLGLSFSTAEAGLYRFGNRIASGATDVITQPMTSFALSRFGAAIRAEQSLAYLLQRFFGVFTLLTGIISAVIIVFAAPAIELLFNPAYLAAIAVTYAMALRALLGIGRILLEPALAAADRTQSMMWFNMIWAAITVVAFFIAVPFGLAAAAWSQAAIMAVSSVAALALIQRKTGTEIGKAIRSGAGALGLSIAYGLVLWITWLVIASSVPDAGLALCIGLVWAVILGLGVLFMGRALRLFDLGVFAG